ncbi:DUF1351 domain-containing protein [Eggerthella lenta]|jgi:archaellum component FlaC|uniref:DUF1351 domain-containing protein n=1 Tax=Eggerthella lenta TaxID=84112 RepID=UPI001EDF9EA4|nr:DUF1351 domain-containing protein [Eggerthella lenta]MCG4515264.1 DUF1351 domain-containing protein [Eggerthella lenta]BDF40047.1 hypothetical protein CE91St33_01090 [Eggerthella lenta]DAM34062.1 MAG TPA: Protein of unknown function (DUF1351) [Caudoviricetes sp.]
MAEEVKAEVIEPVNLAKAPKPAIAYTLPTVRIENLDDIDAFVSDIERFFGGVEIDVDDQEQVKQLRDLRADINKVAKAIDDGRKGMDKAINGAMAEADDAMNDLRDRVKSVYDATGKQIDEAAERQKQARINILAGEYEAVAPDLMELIPLEVFIAKNQKLVSRDKRFTGDKACDLLDEMIADAVHDRERIREAEYATEADMAYCRTLDIRAALDENDRLKREKAEREAHEQAATRLDIAVGRAHEAVMAANASEADKEPPEPETPPQKPSKRFLFRLEFEATEEDGIKVRDFMRNMPSLEGKLYKKVKEV